MKLYNAFFSLLLWVTLTYSQDLDTNKTPKMTTEGTMSNVTEALMALAEHEPVDLTHILVEDVNNKDPMMFNKSSLEPTIGTHVIAPCRHNLNSTICAENIPLSDLIAPAVVLDMRGIVWDNSTARITDKDLDDWEAKNGKIPNGSVVLFQTGWSVHWSDFAVYRGSASSNSSLFVFPDIDVSAAEWLTTNRSFSGVGIDCFSLERNNGSEVHTILANQNMFVVENLDNLDHLQPFGSKLFVLPLRVQGAGAAPCRVLALVPGKPVVRPAPTSTVAPLTTLTSVTEKPSTDPTHNTIPDNPNHQESKKPSSSGHFQPTNVLILISCLASFMLNMSFRKSDTR